MDPEIISPSLVKRLNESLKYFVRWTKEIFGKFKEFCSTQGRSFIVALWNSFNLLDAFYLGILVYGLKTAYNYFFPGK